MSIGGARGRNLDGEGIQARSVKWDLSVPSLYEEIIRREEGVLAADGPLSCRTGQHTGRSPGDKYIVRESSSAHRIAWGATNRPLAPAQFEALRRDLIASLTGKDLYVQECHAGADPHYRLPIRVITEYAWHSLFARNLFLPGSHEAGDEPEFRIVDSPSFEADPVRHGTRSSTVVAINFAERLVLIGGTSYAGEIKKSVFSVLNYLLPLRGVLPMHCSANVGARGDVALFFGLSGTGKTALSSDAERLLIGDDEHGWSDRGVFNFEGGCYAKTIRLSPSAEPQIFAATRRFGTILENVVIEPESRQLNLDDDRYTENTRAAYPIAFIENVVPDGQAGHPENIVMLTADAFGVLPPVARLSEDGAMYHFLSGYTARVAGTERGVTAPQATFSACFGAPFLPLPPTEYAHLLRARIATCRSRVWLVNTGWTGGPYGTGHRMPIAHTRAMLRAILSGALHTVEFARDPVLNLDVPLTCPDVPARELNPRQTWTRAADYDAQARAPARMFADNFRTFEADVTPGVRAAGPSGQ